MSIPRHLHPLPNNLLVNTLYSSNDGLFNRNALWNRRDPSLWNGNHVLTSRLVVAMGNGKSKNDLYVYEINI